MKRFLYVAIVAVIAGAFSAAANASLINVNFDGSYTGKAATGVSDTDFWNTVVGDDWSGNSSASGVALKDSTQTATTVTMDYSGSGRYFGNNVNDSSNQFPFKSNSLHGLMDGFLFGNSNYSPKTSITVTLHKLAAGKYQLYLYDSSDVSDRVGTFTVTTSVNTAGVSTVIGPNNLESTLIESTSTTYDSTNTKSSNYGVVEVEVGGNGELTITGVTNAKEVDLCGFQLKSVPEPTAMAMVIGGGLCLVAYAWRKRRK